MSKLFLFVSSFIIFCNAVAQHQKSKCSILFENICNSKKIKINEVDFKNNFGETYSITKLKYYVSNLQFVYQQKINTAPTVYLIDAAKETLINVPIKSKQIIGISFLLGVDSLQNFSGAQSGALDPLNDMFWTWNNGYIVLKLEGKSIFSTADNNRIEQHIGGYKGIYKTTRKIYLPLSQNYFKQHSNIIIQLNLDKYWDGINKIQIAKTPVIASPGLLAKDAADNFAGMFSIKNK